MQKKFVLYEKMKDFYRTHPLEGSMLVEVNGKMITMYTTDSDEMFQWVSEQQKINQRNKDNEI